MGRVTADLLANLRNPGSLSRSLSAKLEGGHFGINEGSQSSPGRGPSGKRGSDSVGVVVQDGRKPTVLCGLAVQPPTPRNQPGDFCQVTPVLGIFCKVRNI